MGDNTVVISKTRKVLERVDRQYAPDHIFYAQTNDDELHPKYLTGVYVSLADVEDMGDPEVITITVEPGDRLNPPGEYDE